MAPRTLKSVAATKPAAAAKSSHKVAKKAPKRQLVPRKLSQQTAERTGSAAAAPSAVGKLLALIPHPRIGKGVVFAVLGVLLALAVAAVVFINSGVFAATDVVVNGSEHVSQDVASKLVDVPEGTSLLGVDEKRILESLQANPWVSDVKVEREFPHTLVITPVERKAKAVAYINSDDIAWAIGEDSTWIAPLSLDIAVDAEGNEVEPAADGALPEGARQISGLEAAMSIAKRDGALLLTDVPADVSPSSGDAVTSEVVQAGIAYANGFSADFLSQIKDLSVASVEAISANLTNGVEVSLGEPENITEKERVITKLLSQEQGVTYINVREPGAYTFRNAPQ